VYTDQDGLPTHGKIGLDLGEAKQSGRIQVEQLTFLEDMPLMQMALEVK
jgi:hypothetical protein